MNKPIALVAAAVAAIAVILWITLGSLPSHTAQRPARTPQAQEPATTAAPPPPPVTVAPPAPTPVPHPVVQAAPAYVPDPTPAPAEPPPVDRRVTDDRAVLGMYQNMADAVDAYGKNQCAAMGQAFITFVSDGAGPIGRLVQEDKAKGQNFTNGFMAAHQADLAKFKPKLREAISRCGTDPNVKRAFQALASVDDSVPDAGVAGATDAGRP